MKHIISSVGTLSAIFVILYFSGELIEKGHYLNTVTPYPVLGYLLWLAAALFLFNVLVLPIYSFLRLTRAAALTHTDLLKRLHRQLRSQRKSPPAERSPLQQLACDAYDDIDTALKLHHRDADMEERAVSLLKKYAHLDAHKAEAEKVVMGYAKATAVAVVLSRNPFLDGLTLLFFQMKMVIDLCRVYGYKPSVVFNLACFGWVLFHSAVATVMQGATQAAGEAISEEVITEIAGEEVVAGVVGQVASGIVSLTLEGVNAGAAVYLTGSIFRTCLEGSAKRLGMKELLTYRKLARKELGGMFMAAGGKGVMYSASQLVTKMNPFA